MSTDSLVLIIGLALQAVTMIGGVAYLVGTLNSTANLLNKNVGDLQTELKALNAHLKFLEIRTSVLEAVFNVTHPKARAVSNEAQMSLFDPETHQTIHPEK